MTEDDKVAWEKILEQANKVMEISDSVLPFRLQRMWSNFKGGRDPKSQLDGSIQLEPNELVDQLDIFLNDRKNARSDPKLELLETLDSYAFVGYSMQKILGMVMPRVDAELPKSAQRSYANAHASVVQAGCDAQKSILSLLGESKVNALVAASEELGKMLKEYIGELDFTRWDNSAQQHYSKTIAGKRLVIFS